MIDSDRESMVFRREKKEERKESCLSVYVG